MECLLQSFLVLLLFFVFFFFFFGSVLFLVLKQGLASGFKLAKYL